MNLDSVGTSKTILESVLRTRRHTIVIDLEKPETRRQNNHIIPSKLATVEVPRVRGNACLRGKKIM